MHARIAAFENRDVSRIDELVETVRDRQSSGAEIPDALGMYMLIDRDAGKMLGISIFESADALQAAEPVFERMGAEVPEELRGKRVSVDAYEVAIHEVSDGATAARVSIMEGDPAKIDDGIRAAAEDVLPEIRGVDGWKGVILLVHRTTGAARIITLWETADALRASEGQADEMRQRTAEAAGETIAGVERYEVPLAFDRAPRTIGV